MRIADKKILIIDEAGFSRVCSAILESEGHWTETLISVDDLASRLENNEFGLIITSYPYGVSLFKEIKKRNIPTIILSDHIDSNLINMLEGFNNSYCMLKPLDYQKFRYTVRQLMNGELSVQEGFNIV